MRSSAFKRQRERLEQFARTGPRGDDAPHLRAGGVEDVDAVAAAIEDDVLAVAGDGKRGVVIELRHHVRRGRSDRLQHVGRRTGNSRRRERKRQQGARREDFGIRYHRAMRLTAAQLNLTVGAFDANFERIRAAVTRAATESSELVVFSEMATTGYPPRDLLTHPAFVDRNLDMLERVARLSTGRLAILVGFVDRNPSSQGKPLLNAAALCRSGRVVERRYKSLLPTYDVFDEDRYFEPAREVSPMPCGDVRLGVTICEDVWNDKDVWTKPRYHRDPVCEVAAAGADVLINISASPFTLGCAGRPAASRDAGGASSTAATSSTSIRSAATTSSCSTATRLASRRTARRSCAAPSSRRTCSRSTCRWAGTASRRRQSRRRFCDPSPSPTRSRRSGRSCSAFATTRESAASRAPSSDCRAASTPR